MEWQDLLTDGYERVLGTLKLVLKGMSADDLNWRPRDDCNSMGWLAWHLTRIQDDHISDLMEEEQLWIKDGWHARFNRPADPADIGFGHTPEQVAAFRAPDARTIIDYHSAVLERSKAFFRTLSRDDLDRELDEPQYQPLPTVGVRLISVLGDNLNHAGQAAYVRGLRQGKGWQKF